MVVGRLFNGFCDEFKQKLLQIKTFLKSPGSSQRQKIVVLVNVAIPAAATASATAAAAATA